MIGHSLCFTEERALGYKEVVDEYNKVEKWYS